MKTTGEELKTRLGLNHLRYVSFIRIIQMTTNVLVIFYDSRHPNVPLTHEQVVRSQAYLSIRTYPFDHNTSVTPLFPLEQFNGILLGSTVLVLDISGTYGDRNLQIRESKLREWLTLADLSTDDATSAFTKKTRDQRNKAVKPENYTAKIKDCVLEKDGSVTFTFNTTATIPIYPKDYKFKQADPNSNFELKDNPEKSYTITIRILDFMKWLKDTRPDFKELGKITWKEIRDVVEVAYIQIYSTSPSFHWQGINWWITQLDGSLYPTDIKPKFWNRDDLHGDEGAFLDKHTAGVVRYFKFWYNPMASMVQKRMKDKNLL